MKNPTWWSSFVTVNVVLLQLDVTNKEKKGEPPYSFGWHIIFPWALLFVASSAAVEGQIMEALIRHVFMQILQV